jgi:iron complex outermembrane receptor protein
MIFQRKKVASALAYMLGVGGAMSLIAAPAQSADIKVDVTGSNIKRIEGEGALPVQIITRAEIEQQGIQTAMGVIDRLSANSSIGGLNLQMSEGATLVGYQTASLRGLGSSRTLVLLNGRRLANTAFSGTAVDINSIPLSAIERVEVLTDGASAIYGTDAIAGVINFILRKDFTGIEAFAYYGDSDDGGGQVQRYNVVGGWGDLTKDKFNVFGTVDYNKIDAIAANQRKFSASAYNPNAPGGVYDRTSGNSIPGNVSIPGVGTRNPGNPACLPPLSFPTTGNSAFQCRFDFASIIDIVPPSESWNVFGSGRWAFAPQQEAYLEGSWSRTEATAKVSPPPISAATILTGDPVLSIPSSPFYPHAFAQQYGVDGQNLTVSWRGLELGPRTDFNTTTQSRVVGGVQGLLGGWDYDVNINWSQSKATTEWKAGWSRGSVLLPILNGGLINLFGLNTPEAISLMSVALIKEKVLDNTGTMTEFNAKASRDIYNLPAGPMALAVGALYRQEKFEQFASEALSSGDVPGLGGSVSSLPEVSRNIWAIYGELNIPIVKNLEANVAIRYDDYADVGTTWNPKVSARWTPIKELLIRGSYGTGFRAPGLPELFLPNFFGATGDIYNDPLRCPTTGSPRDCDAQFTTRLGGNPDLKPETSTSYTFGFVLEPVPQFSFGSEYYWIKVKNVIGVKGEASIFSDMPAAEAAGLLVRFAPGSAGCPPSEQVGGIPCPVAFGIQNNINLSQLVTSGVDFTASWRPPATAFGQFSAAFQGTYTIKWDQAEQGGETQHLVGTYAGGVAATVSGNGATGAFPRWKHNLNLGWTYGPWAANLNQLYVNGYTEPSDDTPTRYVGAYSVWGLNGAYTGFKNFTLTLGVKNLLNTDPPYTRQSQSFQVGYDPALTDPTGRFYYGSIRYAFK